MNRAEYMNNEGLVGLSCAEHNSATWEKHRAYYGQYVTARVKGAVLGIFPKKALVMSMDQHLNDVGSLRKWDAVGAYFNSAELSKAMKANGDYVTKATLVCIAKEAARQIVEEMTPNAGRVYLGEKGETLADYAGACVELAGDIGGDREGWGLAWIERPSKLPLIPSSECALRGYVWKHHAVAVDPEGLVHDPWFPALVLPVEEYVAKAFPNQQAGVEMNPGREEADGCISN